MQPKTELNALLLAAGVAIAITWIITVLADLSGHLRLVLACFAVISAFLYLAVTRPYLRRLEELNRKVREETDTNYRRCVGLYRLCERLISIYKDKPGEISRLSAEVPEDIAKLLGRWKLDIIPTPAEIVGQMREYVNLISPLSSLKPPLNPRWKSYKFLWHSRRTTPEITSWREITGENPEGKETEADTKENEKVAQQRVLETLCGVVFYLIQPLLAQTEGDLKRYKGANTEGNEKEEKAKSESVRAQIADFENLVRSLYRALRPFVQSLRLYGESLEKMTRRVQQMNIEFLGETTARKNRTARKRG